jgi:ribosomal protein S27AE
MINDTALMQIKGIIATERSRMQRELPTDNGSQKYIRLRKAELEQAIQTIHVLLQPIDETGLYNEHRFGCAKCGHTEVVSAHSTLAAVARLTKAGWFFNQSPDGSFQTQFCSRCAQPGKAKER